MALHLATHLHRSGTGLTPCRHLHRAHPTATSAPGTGPTPCCHLHRDWAHPCPHLHQDWAHPCPHLHRDWARPAHICTGTGLTPIPPPSLGFRMRTCLQQCTGVCRFGGARVCARAARSHSRSTTQRSATPLQPVATRDNMLKQALGSACRQPIVGGADRTIRLDYDAQIRCTDDVLHSAGTVLRQTCSVQHARCSIQRAAYNVHRAACRMHRAAGVTDDGSHLAATVECFGRHRRSPSLATGGPPQTRASARRCGRMRARPPWSAHRWASERSACA